jgi:hypothetical protein
MKELANLYIQAGAELYRFKVFENMIGIERQTPPGQNCLLPKTYSPQTFTLYNPQITAWNLESILALIEAYPYPDYYADSE